jgi:hypothetical protein
VQVFPKRRKPLRKESLVPGEGAVRQSILYRPPAVYSDIAISELCETGVDEGFSVAVHDAFVRKAVVLVVGVPSIGLSRVYYRGKETNPI